MVDPVIVTGAARSGTSLTMGCLVRCGLQVGKHCGPTPWNERGQYENRELIQTAQKAYLKSIGADPAGQHPLPTYEQLEPDPGRRDRVLDVVRRQGVDTDQPWGFKDAKALVDWPVWADAFPHAVWVVTWRDRDSVVQSCLRTRFMRAYADEQGWAGWWDYHEERAQSLLRHAVGRAYRVNTPLLQAGRTDLLFDPVRASGLEWRPGEIEAFVSPDLWHFNSRENS